MTYKHQTPAYVLLLMIAFGLQRLSIPLTPIYTHLHTHVGQTTADLARKCVFFFVPVPPGAIGGATYRYLPQCAPERPQVPEHPLQNEANSGHVLLPLLYLYLQMPYCRLLAICTTTCSAFISALLVGTGSLRTRSISRVAWHAKGPIGTAVCM
jgi:hypothetical protein